MLTTADYIVIGVYLAAVITFGLRAAGKQTSTRDYFLGGNELPWWAICFSIVATETSTLTVIGVPAVAYGGSLTFFQLTFGYLAGRILVAVILLPKYWEGELSTAYELIGRRFGSGLRRISSATFLLTRLLADGVRLFATAIPIRIIALAAGYDVGYPVIIITIAVATAIYTYVGGLKAVVWMDVVQMSVYLFGAVVTIVLAAGLVPEGAFGRFSAAGKLETFNFTMDPVTWLTSPYAFVTAVVGGAVFSMASHGTDQLIVQRLLACRSLADARKAIVGSAVFIMVQFALFLAVGAVLWMYYEGADAAALGLTRADEVFPKFVVEQLPSGLAGLVLAGIVAAAMSTLSSSLNALASSSVWDIWPEGLENADDARRLAVSRALTLFWTVIFVGFALLFEDMDNPVVELGLSVASFTYGALLGAFALGVLTKNVTEADAIPAFLITVVMMSLIIFGVWVTPDGSFIFAFGPSEAQIVEMGMARLAWPWYTLLGTLISLASGSLISLRHRYGHVSER